MHFVVEQQYQKFPSLGIHKDEIIFAGKEFECRDAAAAYLIVEILTDQQVSRLEQAGKEVVRGIVVSGGLKPFPLHESSEIKLKFQISMCLP